MNKTVFSGEVGWERVKVLVVRAPQGWYVNTMAKSFAANNLSISNTYVPDPSMNMNPEDFAWPGMKKEE